MTDWLPIEQAARADALVALETTEQKPLVFGAPIAWGERLYGLTDRLSIVHRVGYPIEGEPHTSCGERIWHPVNWITLTPSLRCVMPSCSYCEVEYRRATREAA